jgi:O-acetyl-ADP-ribose deacetylase (regulator of RNase III)
MPTEIITGNIFTSTAQTLVNTVNCVGVMGAGIALENRLRHPEMFEKYVELCDKGLITIGKLWLYRTGTPWVLNFPTKQHWKFPSKLDYIEQGLQKFVQTYEAKGVESIAFPVLGADKGGIPVESSISLMRRYLDTLPIKISIYRYDPKAKDDLLDEVKAWVLSASPEELQETTGIQRQYVDRIVEAFKLTQDGAIYQLNQLLGVKGVGVSTVEKLFRASRRPASVASQASLF